MFGGSRSSRSLSTESSDRAATRSGSRSDSPESSGTGTTGSRPRRTRSTPCAPTSATRLAAVSELDVSTDQTWLENLGVIPAASSQAGDDLVREVRIPIDRTAELHATWDVTDGSVRLRYRQSDRVLIDTFRERARRLLAIESDGERTVVVEYGGHDATGRIEVRIAPDFAWTDKLLLA